MTHFVKYQNNKLRTSKSYVHFLETACRRGRRGTFLYAYTHYDLCGTGFVGGYQNFATFSMSVCMSVCVKVVGRYKTFDGVPDKKYCVYYTKLRGVRSLICISTPHTSRIRGRSWLKFCNLKRFLRFRRKSI